MRLSVASLVAVAGMAAAASGQVAIMRMLVSTDGVNFSSSVDALPGSHVEALVTVSYTGNPALVAGFGSAIFQPTVSNWRTGAHPDQLSPIQEGGNFLGGVIQPQTGGAGLGSTNPYATPTVGGPGGMVPASPYAAGTYGRVYPLAEVYLGGVDGLQGFVHANPDGSGQTYLRIAQAQLTDWFNPATNFSGGSGVNMRQAFIVGRSTRDPDFWGNRDTTYDPGDPGERDSGEL
jgi:hypothetical protein